MLSENPEVKLIAGCVNASKDHKENKTYDKVNSSVDALSLCIKDVN
jgi:outer membrane murein-binding lipoprotein Lpp